MLLQAEHPTLFPVRLQLSIIPLMQIVVSIGQA